MGLLELLSGETRQSPRDLLANEDWSPLALAGPTFAGVDVAPETAFGVSTINACVRVIAETISSLPFPVRKDVGDGDREPLRTHPVWGLLNRAPNRKQTAMTWRELTCVDILAWGNHFSLIDRVRSNGTVHGYRRFDPWNVEVTADGNDLFYRIRLPGGAFSDTIPAEMMLHVPGLGFNGVMGKSVIGMARQGVGLALATEQFGARWFGNGSRPTGVFVHPGKLSPKARDNLIESLREAYQGVQKSHGVIVLEEGAKWESMGVPPDDAQFIETRRYTNEDLARFFRVPGHMIGIRDNQPRANVEQESIDFVTHTVRPWCVRIEQEINRKSFITEPGVAAEHNVDGLLRGDLKSRYDAYGKGRIGGWLSANDVRRREGMNQIEGGDTFMVPMNMVPADQFEELAAANARVESTLRLAFRDAMTRVLRKERKEVEKAEQRLSGAALESWRLKFYEDHHGAMDAAFGPIVSGITATLAQRMSVDSQCLPDIINYQLRGFWGIRDSGTDEDSEDMDRRLRDLVNNIVCHLAVVRDWKTTRSGPWVVEVNGDQDHVRFGKQSGSGTFSALMAPD